MAWFPNKPSVGADIKDFFWKPWFQSIWRAIYGLTHVTTSQTTAQTITEEFLYPVDATAGGITITLPPASSWAYKQYVIRKTDSSANVVTVAVSGSDTVDGVGTVLLLKYQYESITLISDGISKWYVLNRGGSYPVKVATLAYATQSAAIGATTCYAVPADGAGWYRVHAAASVTTAATTSSAVGGTNTGLQLIYTDPVDSVAKTTNGAGAWANAGNTTGTACHASVMAYCKASTNLQFTFGYTSVGATSMVYDLKILVEYLGP